jgi:galactose mutarotase-like enzyme
METINNSLLTVAVNGHGAELCSIRNNKSGWEYLWQAEPAYWKRHAPVLFPIVGSVWNGEYRQDGQIYKMSQHGFARDMDFELMTKSDNELRYRLADNEATHAKYPYPFELEIGYRLVDNRLTVMWQVDNPSDNDIFFQIGAHPAFNYKNYNDRADVQAYFEIAPSASSLQLTVIGEKGCITLRKKPYLLENNCISIDKATFNDDALVFEDNQVKEVVLSDAAHQPYVKLSFDAPVVGLWSPAKNGYAPFACIEPWYGRCDRMNYAGEYKDKDWMQHLKSGETFNAEYMIELS